MASWQKRGENSYLLTAALGIDVSGKQIRKTKTVHLGPEFKTDKQKAKELDRLCVVFQEEAERGLSNDGGKLKLQEFAVKWFEDYVNKDLTEGTKQFYKNFFYLRINPALGHIRLNELQPQHWLDLERELRESGIRKDTKYTLNEEYRKLIHIAPDKGIKARNVTSLRNGRHVTEKIAESVCDAFGKPLSEMFTPVGDDKKLSAQTVKHCYRTLSSMLSTAVNWMYIKDNPLQRVKAPKIPRKAADHYEEEEVMEMLARLEKAPLKYQCAIAIALFGGLRLGEIAALEWSDLDFNKLTVYVNKQLQYSPEIGAYEKEPKTESGERIVALDGVIFEQLKVYKKWQDEEKLKLGALWEEHNKLFTQDNGRPIHHSTLSHWWSDWLEKEGLRHLKFHGLRHTSATYQIAHDVDIASVSANLGHATPAVTNSIYVHALKRKRFEATRAMCSWAREALSKKPD